MFDDPSVKQLLFHAGTKLAVFVVLVILWAEWTRRSLLPYLASRRPLGSASGEANNGASTKSAPRPFPLYGLIGCVVLGIVFIYYATFEVAYRDVNPVDDSLVQQREKHLQEKDAQAGDIQVAPDGLPSLDDKSQQKLEQAKRDTDASKQEFQELEPVDQPSQ